MTARKKPTAGFWITVALVAVLVGYPLSFGPACWLEERGTTPDWCVTSFEVIYSPLYWIMFNGPQPIARFLWWYFKLWRG